MAKNIIIFGVLSALVIFMYASALPQNSVTITFPSSGHFPVSCNFTLLSGNITDATNVVIGNDNWMCIDMIDHSFHTCSCAQIDVTQLIFELLLQTIGQGAEGIISTIGSFIGNLFG